MSEWYGTLPERWENKRIVTLFSEISDSNNELQSDTPMQFRYGEIMRKKIPQLDDAYLESIRRYTLIQPNDILINGLNLNYDFVTQRVAITREQGCITPAYICIRSKSQINPMYYCYVLKSMDAEKRLNGLGSGIRLTLSFSELKNVQIPLPPRPEQDQIVRYLDWKASQINKLINAKRRKIELLKEQKQAIINQVVTRGLNRNVPMKDSDIAWIGAVPEHWNTRALFGLATERKVKNVGLTNTNLLSLSYGNIKRKDINTTDGLLPISFETYQIVDKGNIILRLTDLQNDHKSLRVGMALEKGIITSAYTCLETRTDVLPEYMRWLLHSYDICKVFYGLGGGVRQSIGYADIKWLQCLVPPTVDEQSDIVKYCNQINYICDTLAEKEEAEINLLHEYRTRLISDVVTGKVDVRNVAVPDYEAVEETADAENEDEEAISLEEAE
jgi:type I restriction enzyme S subunit